MSEKKEQIKKPRGVRFGEGQKSGRKKLPDDLKNVKDLSKDTVRKLISKLSELNLDQLRKLVKDEKTTSIEVMVGQCMIHAIAQGDYKRIQFLLDRSIGKVEEQHKHSFGNDFHEQLVEIIRANKRRKQE